MEAETEALPEGWVWADRAELAKVYAVPTAIQSFSPIGAEMLGR